MQYISTTKPILMMYRFFVFLFFYTTIFYAQIADATNIKTVTISSNSKEFIQPIQPLNTSFSFGFDDTNGVQDEYYYLITHCNIDWKPSELPVSYYIDGFHNMQINTVENSFGTLQNYTHYEFLIPNKNTKITKSGNYLFQILNEQDEVVCERKIILYERKVSIDLKISESRDLVLLNQKQALSMVIQNSSLPINYPNTEIKTFIFQNGDLQISTPFLTPTFMEQNSYTYRPSNNTEFIAGNEFYYFDNHEILRNSRFVLTAFREDNYFNTILFTQKSRFNTLYNYNPDINGNFVIRNIYSDKPNTEAEYSYVLFSLSNEPRFKNHDIYVYGAFNNYQLTDDNKLTIDASGKYLNCNIFLKQGFYNYDYVIKRNGKIDKKFVSGSFYETENNYGALVYFKPLNSIYYEVVGYGVANSKQQIEN